MKKYIQLQDSYDSKKGDIWEQITRSGYTHILSGRFLDNNTIERNPDWFAPYEEKKEYAKRWEDLKEISGDFVDNDSEIGSSIDFPIGEHNKNIYATENQVKAALAEAQLSQLLKEIYEWEGWYPDWKNNDQWKYCILSKKGHIFIEETVGGIGIFISLPTTQLAEQFLENRRELIETYYKKVEW